MKKCFWLLAASLMAAVGFAQTKPDFSGVWKLDPLRSRLTATEESSHTVLRIEHHEPRVLIVTTTSGRNGETDMKLDLATDNSSHQEVIGGRSVTASARWDPWEKDHLVWRVQQETPDGTLLVTREATLGDKGKILTTVLTVKDKAGEHKSYEFFVKE